MYDFKSGCRIRQPASVLIAGYYSRWVHIVQGTTAGGRGQCRTQSVCRLLQPAGAYSAGCYSRRDPGSHGGSDVEGAERRLDVSRHLYLHDLRQQVPGRRRKIGKKRFYLKVSSRLTKFIRHRYSDRYLPPGNEVWGKVIFSQACVIPSVHKGVGVYPSM